MQIIIPMSGFGERFRRAGYSLPKPLIPIDGKPIIAHVIDMFQERRIFCLSATRTISTTRTTRCEPRLNAIVPPAVSWASRPKLGPVHAVRLAEHLIRDDSPVVVNYCDFTCYWDWPQFVRFTSETGCAGAIPPIRDSIHTLGSTNYAYMREQDGWVLDIQEKQPYAEPHGGVRFQRYLLFPEWRPDEARIQGNRGSPATSTENTM